MEAGRLVPERERLLSDGLPLAVIETKQSARAPSTMFTRWCEAPSEEPLHCSIGKMFSFLHSLFDKGLLLLH